MKTITNNKYEWLLKDPPFYPPFKIIDGDNQIEIVDDDTIPDQLSGVTYEEIKYGEN